eukprot:jgi/Botrbrau1/21632/Bobra.43_1s0034.1
MMWILRMGSPTTNQEPIVYTLVCLCFPQRLGYAGWRQETSCVYGGHGEYWWCIHNLFPALRVMHILPFF